MSASCGQPTVEAIYTTFNMISLSWSLPADLSPSLRVLSWLPACVDIPWPGYLFGFVVIELKNNSYCNFYQCHLTHVSDFTFYLAAINYMALQRWHRTGCADLQRHPHHQLIVCVYIFRPLPYFIFIHEHVEGHCHHSRYQIESSRQADFTHNFQPSRINEKEREKKLQVHTRPPLRRYWQHESRQVIESQG